MIDEVLDLLADEHWFDRSRPFEVSINLTQGACLWLLLTRRGVSDTYVKFSDCFELRQEAARAAAASARYPGLAPAFIGHASRGALQVLVCRAVPYRRLSPAQLFHPRHGQRALADLLGYFDAMQRPQAVQGPGLSAAAEPAELLQALQAYFAGQPSAALARRWLRNDALSRLARVVPHAQHGDLVLNNIGVTPSGAAVVFDWEDLSASWLTGLDLFTLELSLAGSAGRLFAARLQPQSPISGLVARACEAMRLRRDDYETLTPLYALVFRYLKRNYGPGVRERMDLLLRDLDQQRNRALD